MTTTELALCLILIMSWSFIGYLLARCRILAEANLNRQLPKVVMSDEPFLKVHTQEGLVEKVLVGGVELEFEIIECDKFGVPLPKEDE